MTDFFPSFMNFFFAIGGFVAGQSISRKINKVEDLISDLDNRKRLRLFHSFNMIFNRWLRLVSVMIVVIGVFPSFLAVIESSDLESINSLRADLDPIDWGTILKGIFMIDELVLTWFWYVRVEFWNYVAAICFIFFKILTKNSYKYLVRCLEQTFIFTAIFTD